MLFDLVFKLLQILFLKNDLFLLFALLLVTILVEIFIILGKTVISALYLISGSIEFDELDELFNTILESMS